MPLCRCSEADRTGTLRPYFIQFKMQADKRTFFRVLLEQERKPLDPMELVYPNEVPVFEKYDEYLPEELVKKGFACGVLGIDEMRGTDSRLGDVCMMLRQYRTKSVWRLCAVLS